MTIRLPRVAEAKRKREFIDFEKKALEMCDVIGIGAINLDYVYSCDDNRYTSQTVREELTESLRTIDEEIRSIIQDNKNLVEPPMRTQIGGAALLTLKAICEQSKELTVAYVGVRGKLGVSNRGIGPLNSDAAVKGELNFLHNKEWLFTEDSGEPDQVIGKALINLQNTYGRGRTMRVSPGANNQLLSRIRRKEQDEDISFSNFLSTAKWVHISSLSSFKDFKKIVADIVAAKKINPRLKASIYPGSFYTFEMRSELEELWKIFDYVFLTNSELNNLAHSHQTGISKEEKYRRLREYLVRSDALNTNVVLIAEDADCEVINFTLGGSFPHASMGELKLSPDANGTGASSYFIGGFIATLLSDRYGLQEALRAGVDAYKMRIDENVRGASTRVPIASNKGFSKALKKRKKDKVFVVYGHDQVARTQLEAMLRRWDLEPLILDQMPHSGRTIIEELEACLDQANYGIVLATPDDIGYPRDDESKRKYRARQNVVLELGMLLSRLGRKNVAILLSKAENVEYPSDIEGLHYIGFKANVEETKIELAREMQACGYDLNPMKL